MSTTADTHHYHFLSLPFSLLSPFPFFLLNTMLVFLLIIRCTDTEKSTWVGGKFNSHTHTYTQTHTKDLSLVSITQNSNKSILQCVTWLLEDRFSALLFSHLLHYSCSEKWTHLIIIKEEREEEATTAALHSHSPWFQQSLLLSSVDSLL